MERKFKNRWDKKYGNVKRSVRSRSPTQFHPTSNYEHSFIVSTAGYQTAPNFKRAMKNDKRNKINESKTGGRPRGALLTGLFYSMSSIWGYEREREGGLTLFRETFGMVETPYITYCVNRVRRRKNTESLEYVFTCTTNANGTKTGRLKETQALRKHTPGVTE